MRKMMFAFAVALALPFAALAQNADKAAKAQEVLKQARAAIGDEAKLKALNSLSANASFRRTQGEREVSGEVELDMLMPDKIKVSTNMQFGPMEITQIQALNGTEVWNDFIGGPGGGQGGPGGGNRGGMMNDPQVRERQQNEMRANLTRLALAILLAPPSSMQLQYSYAAEAQTPNGKADIIDVTGANNFKARLVIDQASHRLFMLSYKAKQMRGFGGPGGGRGPGQGGGQGAQGGQGGQRPQMTPEEIEKRRKEMQEAYEKAPEVEFQWVMSEYKTVNGLSLPHRILRGEAGTPNEEWNISKYKINPSLKADKFVKKDKNQG